MCCMRNWSGMKAGIGITMSMSQGRQPPVTHECRLTEPAASPWLNALVSWPGAHDSDCSFRRLTRQRIKEAATQARPIRRRAACGAAKADSWSPSVRRAKPPRPQTPTPASAPRRMFIMMFMLWQATNESAHRWRPLRSSRIGRARGGAAIR